MLLQTLQRNSQLLKKIKSGPKLQDLLTQICKQNHCRLLSTSPKRDLVLYKLRSRGLVQLKGPDVISLLQGIVTSDVTMLGAETSAQYSMLLNVQGRVMYDVLLYHSSSYVGEHAIWMECDRELTGKLIADMKKYKIRKKVAIDDISDESAVLAGFGEIPDDIFQQKDVVISTPDPRVPAFGARILASSAIVKELPMAEGDDDYHERRMRWGIPEGHVDLPPGNCLPLESNLVFMNGVSFSKGCYLGQELTARTQHTGVTRKRIMPLQFSEPPGEIEPGSNILNAKGKSAGKFRSCVGRYGLGLVRTAEIGGELTVTTKSGETVAMTVTQPDWWPKEGV